MARPGCHSKLKGAPLDILNKFSKETQSSSVSAFYHVTFLSVTPFLFKAGFSVIGMIKSKYHMKSHIGTVNQQSVGTSALHNAQHISEHSVTLVVIIIISGEFPESNRNARPRI